MYGSINVVNTSNMLQSSDGVNDSSNIRQDTNSLNTSFQPGIKIVQKTSGVLKQVPIKSVSKKMQP